MVWDVTIKSSPGRQTFDTFVLRMVWNKEMLYRQCI